MKKITNFELGSIVYFLSRAYFIGISLNTLRVISKQDSWFSILLATLIGIIPLLIFLYIFNYEPDLNLNQKIIKLFGKVFGNIINILLLLFTLFLITIDFSNIVTIIHGDYLSKTPVIFLAIAFIISVFYSVTKGLKTICRSCLIFFYASILLVIISNIGLLVQLDFNNFKPLFLNGGNILKGSFIHLSFNILPLYLINIIPKNQIKNNNKSNLNIFLFYFLANITLFLVAFCIIGIFGIKLATLYQYPEFQMLKHVALIGLSSRLDSILFIQWIFDILILIIIGLYYIVNTTHMFIKEKKNICLFIYCLIIVISTLLVPNNLFLNYISTRTLPIIISVFITTIFILLCVKIKYTKKIKR